ncbi:MAG: formate dehydrogenase accessory sulfurtransferase FdhD [Chthoniobacterales bacterium]
MNPSNALRSPLSSEFIIMRIDSGVVDPTCQDRVAIEEPLEIRVEGKSIAVVMRTPGHDQELTAGFLLSEGLIAQRSDVFEISECPSVQTEEAKGNVIDVLLKNPNPEKIAALTRHVFTSSSCGICGKATIESVMEKHPHFPVNITIARDILFSLPDKLAEKQKTFQETGGLHASALFDLAGNLLTLREDVGRHNALDKVIGHALMENKISLSETILLVSGRVSFEIVQKALVAGIPCIAAISAPTSLAIKLAQSSERILVGFLRGSRMNIYSGEKHIIS